MPTNEFSCSLSSCFLSCPAGRWSSWAGVWLPARASSPPWQLTAHDKQGPVAARPGHGPCTASVGGCVSSQAPAKHRLCLELSAAVCCPLILIPGLCMWIVDSKLKFCFSLSLLTHSVYTKRWHWRDVFSIGLCISFLVMKNIKWSKNGHISCEKIKFQAMQCFPSICYPLEILMHRDVRDKNLPPALKICLELEPGPCLCPGHGLPGW